VPFLVDVTEQLEPHVLCRLYSLYTVVFSSPNPFKYTQFPKHDRAGEYLMEPWKLHQLIAAKRSIARYKHLSDAQVHSLYDVCGRVPGYVLARNEDGMAFMEDALMNQGTGAVLHYNRRRRTLHARSLIPNRTRPLKKQRYRYEPASGFVLGELMKINEAAVSERYSQKILPGGQRSRAIL
jgi:hypothetical protein